MAANINAFEIFAKIGADVNPLKVGLKSAKGMLGVFGKSFGGLNSIANSVFSGIGGLAAKAFSGLVGGATKLMDEARQKAGAFEQSMAQVAATLGKTIGELDADVQTVTYHGQEFTGNLREYAMELGATTKFTATEVGEAMNYMALAGYDTVTTMRMLPNVLDLAAAGMFDLGHASDMVTDVGTAFGLDARTEEGVQRITQMVDEMAKSASSGNTSVQQLGEAFLRIGGLAKEVGGGTITLSDGTKATTDNIQELEIALVSMANAGVKSSEAGIHMRNMLMKLSSPEEAGTKQLEALGVAVFDTAGNMRSLHDIFKDLNTALSSKTSQERLGAISDLFNARDTASAQAILAAVSKTDWDKLGEAILNAEGAAAKMAETQLDTVQGAKTLLVSAWDNFLITMNSSVNIPLGNIYKYLTETVGNLTSALQEGGWSGLVNQFTLEADSILGSIIESIPEMIRKALLKVPMFVARVFPQILKSISNIISSLASGTGSNGGIAKALHTAVTNTMFVLRSQFEKKGPEIAEAGRTLFENIVSGLVTAAEFVGEHIVPVMLSLKNAFANSASYLLDVGGTIIDKLIEGITSEESLNAFFDEETGIIPILTTIVEAIGKFAYKLLDAAVKIIDAIGKYLVDDKNKEKLKGQASEFLEKFGWHLGQVVSKLWEGVVAICTYLTEGIVGEFDADETAGSLIWKLVKAILKAAAEIPRMLINPIDWGLEHIYGAANRAEMAEMEEFNNSGSTLTFDAWKAQRAEQVAADQEAGRIQRPSEQQAALDKYNAMTPRSRYEAKEWISIHDIQGVPDSALPKFGNGGIVDRPTLAVVGDDGREAIVPLDKDSAIGRRFGGVSISFGNIYVQGGKNAGQEVVRQIDEALRIYQIQQGRGIGATSY